MDNNMNEVFQVGFDVAHQNFSGQDKHDLAEAISIFINEYKTVDGKSTGCLNGCYDFVDMTKEYEALGY